MKKGRKRSGSLMKKLGSERGQIDNELEQQMKIQKGTEMLAKEESYHQEGVADLLKEKIGKDWNEKIVRKSNEEIEKRLSWNAKKTATKKQFDSGEATHLGSRELLKDNFGSRESSTRRIPDIREFPKVISDVSIGKKETSERYRKKEMKESAKYTVDPRKTARKMKEWDRRDEVDKKKERLIEETVAKKNMPRRKPVVRPYCYNDLLDGIPDSLQVTDEDFQKVGANSARSNFYDGRKNTLPENSKETKSAIQRSKRTPRPFCYDESLDGVTESLLSTSASDDTETDENRRPSCGNVLAQMPLNVKETLDNNNQAKKLSQSIESESEESETDGEQEIQSQMPNKDNLFGLKPEGTKVQPDIISAQKLVKGKDRLSNTIMFNEGAVHLFPTTMNDSRYINASQINIPYGNFIIAQSPTKQSQINFLRMLWQCHVLLVVCLEPATNQNTCYSYFSLKRQQATKERERIFLEIVQIVRTPVKNLFIYETALTNMELRNGANRRRIYILHYDKWTHEKAISPMSLIKMITIMKGMDDEEKRKAIVVHGITIQQAATFVITSILMQQLTKTHRISIINAAVTVRKRRYDSLKFLTDFRLVLQTILYYAKQCDLITNEKTFKSAMDILERKDRDI
uniref:Tyrosine-protein phosphatase domain-containing protein n=1 Tax=Setaria digitata TaxID=48799 RepID=A0A915PL45_9BILA